MINRSKQVPLDDAESGMVLAEAVRDGQNAVLLPEATTLTDTQLRSLERRGIGHVVIVDNEISQEEWEAESRRVQVRLVRLFRNCAGSGASDVLKQCVFEYRMGTET